MSSIEEKMERNDSDYFRHELRPFVKQRVFVKGVLVDIRKPNQKNKNTYGLVFASIHLPNENIELDHAVIAVSQSFINKNDLKLYDIYEFTALVGTYDHSRYFKNLNVSVMTKAYQLTTINFKRFKPSYFEESLVNTLSLYLKNRVNQKSSLSIFKQTPEELTQTLLNLPNSGEREEYVNTLSKARQAVKLNTDYILNICYGHND